MPFLPDQPEIQSLYKIIQKTKVRVFLVGGYLRDAQVGRSGRDLDFAVSSGAVALARRFAKAVKGAFVLLDADHGCGRVVRKRPDGVWTYDFSDLRAPTIRGDLLRRDFTINTFAADISAVEGALHQTPLRVMSHPRAKADMAAKMIRMAFAGAFKDDPLRILRAYSLSAQLGFKIEPLTRARIKSECPLIKNVSPERVREELFKVLQSPRAGGVIKDMDRDGVLFMVMPQVRVMYKVVQGGYHHLDVWKHSLETLVQLEKLLIELAAEPDVKVYLDEEIAGGHTRGAILKLACLWHDIGKPDTMKKEPGGRTSFHGHEHVGRRIVHIMARQLLFSTKERHALEDMVTLHLRPGYLANFKQPSDKAVFRYFRDAGDEAAAILLLCMADQRATRGPLTTEEDLQHMQDICLPLMRLYFQKKKEKPFVRLVGGDDLIRDLGLKPGPNFAVLLEKVEEAQHLGKITTKEQALELVRKAVS
ncbi:MAG: HD domain-containing protein [Candidatus Omnitrophota bacterium]